MTSARLFAALALTASVAAANPALAKDTPKKEFAVAPQYDTTHVYVAPDDVDKFVTSFLATFGG
ncbi:glyoxalase, partial [Acinetobacter baumannii]